MSFSHDGCDYLSTRWVLLLYLSFPPSAFFPMTCDSRRVFSIGGGGGDNACVPALPNRHPCCGVATAECSRSRLFLTETLHLFAQPHSPLHR